MDKSSKLRVGIYGGGFKPFTTGHYSKLLYACGDNGVCKKNDVVILFYGMGSREKGSSYVFTTEMAHSIFDVMKAAIERELGGEVEIHVIKAYPQPPLAYVFAAASDFAGVSHPPTFSFSDIGIDPGDIETLTIYGDTEGLADYKRHLGTPREEKYFGDTYQTGRLQFDPGYDESDAAILSPDERVVQKFMKRHPDLSQEEAEDKVRVRGSNVRAAIMSRDPNVISRYLPGFLNDDERNQIVDILLTGVPEENPQMSESLIRYMIRGFLAN